MMRHSLFAASLIVTLAASPLAHVGLADDGSRPHVVVEAPSSEHQLWLASTRLASSSPRLRQVDRLQYWRFDPNDQWTASSLPELLSADDPDETTLIFVHENRVSQAESFQRARIVFGRLEKIAPAERRFRMIAISWPADRIGHRQRRDVQIKAQRSEAHGFYLAWLLDQINPDVPVTLFGDSYGPRMITAALHCLGGGSIQSQRLASRTHPTRKPVRAVLMAAALDSHWLSPGQRHGLALTQVDQMLVTINRADPALRFYPRLYRLVPRGADALGYGGASCGLGQHAGKIVEWDVRCIVGPTHNWQAYAGSPQLMQQIAPYLFGQ